MQITIDTLKTIDAVAQVKTWNDRIYVTLNGINGAFKADRNVKIWSRGDTLTIESAKGYHSTEFGSARDALAEAIVAAGGKVRRI